MSETVDGIEYCLQGEIVNRDDREDEVSRKMNEILSLSKDSAIDQAGMSQFDHCPPEEAVQQYPRIAYEWNFIGKYICRVIESAPGIVHFEEARIEKGDPAIMVFERTDKPMGTANEILQLNGRWMDRMQKWEGCEDHCSELIEKNRRLRATLLDVRQFICRGRSPYPLSDAERVIVFEIDKARGTEPES